MKLSKSVWVAFGLIFLAVTLYRVWDGRPYGFAPQIAMALFAGAVIKDKKLAILVPVLSLLISDGIYQLLFISGMTPIPGFYEGQWLNYLLFAGLVFMGFLMNGNKVSHVLLGSVAGVMVFFLVSNFAVWAFGWLALNDLPYARSWDGLMAAYAAGIPFLRPSLFSTLIFSGIFFGAFHVLGMYNNTKELAKA